MCTTLVYLVRDPFVCSLAPICVTSKYEVFSPLLWSFGLQTNWQSLKIFRASTLGYVDGSYPSVVGNCFE